MQSSVPNSLETRAIGSLPALMRRAGDAPAQGIPFGWFLLILCVTFVGYELTELPRALVSDHCGFMSMARDMARGVMPFRDQHGTFPMTMLYHYFVFEVFGNNHWGLRAADGILLICTAIFIYGFLRPLLSRTAILLICLLWLFQYDYAPGVSQAQRDTIVIPFLLAGVWAARKSVRDPSAAFWMSLCICIPIWIKPTHIFTGLLAEVAVLAHIMLQGAQPRLRQAAKQIAWASCGVLAISVPLVMWMLLLADFDALWTRLITMAINCSPIQPKASWLTVPRMLWSTGMPSMLIPLGLMHACKRTNIAQLWPVLVLLCGTALHMVFQRGLPYHALPLLFTLVLIAGLGAERVLSRDRKAFRCGVMMVGLWGLLTLLMAGFSGEGHLAKVFPTGLYLVAPVLVCVFYLLVWGIGRRERRTRLDMLWLAILFGLWPSVGLVAKIGDDMHTMMSKGLQGYRQHRSKVYADAPVGLAIRDATDPDDSIVLLGTQNVVYWAAERKSATHDRHYHSILMLSAGDLRDRLRIEYRQEIRDHRPVVVGVERETLHEYLEMFSDWPEDPYREIFEVAGFKDWFQTNYVSIGDYHSRGSSRTVTYFVRIDRPEVKDRLLQDIRMQDAARKLIEFYKRRELARRKSQTGILR